MKHSKIKQYTPLDEDKREIRTQSYFEDLNSEKTEIEQSILTTTNALLTDVIKCLSVLKEHQTPELNIRIYMDKNGQPFRIVKRYTTQKKKY